MLGFIGYFRKYIKNFLRRAKPLFDMLRTKDTSRQRKQKRTKSGRRIGQAPSGQVVKWTEEDQVTLTELIKELRERPIMIYPDYKKPFILHTDASLDGLGAVLYQRKEDGTLGVIAYGSRTLTPAEKNYHSGKLEFLALKWVITDRFRDHLYYSQGLDVYTDNNPLTYILSTARLDGTRHRWLTDLSDFTFNIYYKPRKHNGDADGLSRMPIQIEDYIQDCTEKITPTGVKAITDEAVGIGQGMGMTATVNKLYVDKVLDNNAAGKTFDRKILDSGDDGNQDSTEVKDQYERKEIRKQGKSSSTEQKKGKVKDSSSTAKPQSNMNSDLQETEDVAQVSKEELRKNQEKDPEIQYIINLISSDRSPSWKDKHTGNLLIREWKKLKIGNDGVLHRHTQVHGQPRKQIVLPKKYRKEVIYKLHNEMGHLGVDRVIALIRERFYGLKMAEEVERYVS